MTQLNINAYGVQELNKQEMIQTEGGFLPIVIAAVVAVAALATGCTYNTTNTYVVGDNNTVPSNSNNPTSAGPGAGIGTNSSTGNGNGSNNQKN